ncbi:MAG: hypothetical protein ACLF0P_10960, partial [Thermoanaerobaculia bacterium]
RPVNPPAPRRLAFPVTPAIACLAGESGEAPDAGGGPRGERVAAVGRALLPNVAAVYGLGDVRLFTPMAPASYLELLRPGIASWSGEIPLLDGDGLGRLPLYDRLAVTRVLTAPAAPCPPGTRELCAGSDARVCERPGALPLLRLERDGEEAAAPPAGSKPAALPLALEAPRADAGGDRWSAGVPGAAWGTLTTGLYAAPGWRVLADGRRLEIPEAGDAPLLSARVPPGTARLELLYRPAGFLLGLLGGALGLSLVVAWLARPPS